jgi:putative type I phosphodiesterase-nucleotide pyrophosphatase
MATGLYPNNHGLVGNEFWDERGARYRLGDRKAVADPAFYKGEPLWNVARRHGVKSASFFWVGSETPIGGHHPDRWKKFNDKVPYTDRADSVLSWLNLPAAERPHLVMWYIEEPDHTGHHNGPESPKTLRMVEKMDSVIGYFRKGLAKLPIHQQVDFILVSDHGMQSFDRSKAVNLADYLPIDSFEHVATGPFTHLYPKKGYTETAYKILKKVPHISVYRKSELPARLHFGSSPRIGELVLIADLGTQIFFRPQGIPKDFLHAGHGFDNKNPEMYAIFKAVGPDFQPGRKVSKPIPNITLYPLVCRILGLQPGTHDADEALASSLLKKK